MCRVVYRVDELGSRFTSSAAAAETDTLWSPPSASPSFAQSLP
jgi:hypothetical protein